MEGLIKELLKTCKERNKSLPIIKRFLSVNYKINISLTALKKRLNHGKT
jgi:hypothetical protein